MFSRAVAIGLLVLVLAVGAVVLSGCTAGQGPATATVNGLTYDFGVVRSLRIEPADLTRYGEVTCHTDPGAYPLAEDVAYALRGITPDEIVIVKWVPGLTDEAGPLGEWAMLSRAVYSEVQGLCAYFDPTSQYTPSHFK